MGDWIPPEVSPPDEEGFRTFSFFAPGVGETLRVSFNLERQHEWLARTSKEEQLYSEVELRRLKLAARLVAALDSFPGHDPSEALDSILELSPKLIAETLDRYFPSFAALAISTAQAVCVKHSLNQTVRGTGAPGMYDD